MWKKVLVLAVLAFTNPVIECNRKNKDSSKSKNCTRTNSVAYRYCTKPCTSNKDCQETRKCLCDGDCGFSCVRKNLRCEDPPKGNNLKLGVSNGRFFGSVITYSCSRPYQLRGSAKRTCRGIGEWDGKKAKCRIICKDPGEVTNGNRRVDGFQSGKTIQYWCFDAYTLEGSPRITCQNSGQWSSLKPVCTLPSCNPPPIPETASVLYPRRMPKTFRYSDRVLLKCKYGYFKTGTGILQCMSETWRGGITCSPKSCGSPGQISNGKVIGYVYTFKEKVRYVCDEGYQLKGPAYRQCQANEKWSGEQPICEVVNCGPLSKPQHGHIIEQVDFTFRNRIVFECNEIGYELNGSRARTCQSDGTWSGSNTTCELVKCGDPGTPANGRQIVNRGYVYRGSVTFVCDTNYILQGISLIFCRADKRWTAFVPQCLDCNGGKPLGMQSGAIPDSSVTASSQNDQHPAHHGRLGGNRFWCSESEKSSYIQIHLPQKYNITAVSIEVKDSSKVGIGLFVLFYSTWVQYHAERPRSRSGKERIVLAQPVIAETIQIRLPRPKKVRSSVCLRAEVYGCEIPRDCIMPGSTVLGLVDGRYLEGKLVRGFEIFYISGFRNLRKTDFVPDEIPSSGELGKDISVLVKDANSDLIREGKIVQTGDPLYIVQTKDGAVNYVNVKDIRVVKEPKFCPP